MVVSKNLENSDLLNQILDKLNSIEEEVVELKNDNEGLLWKKSLEHSLNKVWDNKADERWSDLL